MIWTIQMCNHFWGIITYSVICESSVDNYDMDTSNMNVLWGFMNWTDLKLLNDIFIKMRVMFFYTTNLKPTY
jgi:hypothetical protein